MALWLKLDTGFMDQDNIKLIRSQPEGNALVILWIQVMCLAMKRETPELYVSEGVPMTSEMLATLSSTDLTITKMGLTLFERLGMITVSDGVIHVDEIVGTQALDQLTKTRTLTAERMRRYRSKPPKQIPEAHVTRNTVTSYATEEEEEEEEEEDKDKSIVGLKPNPTPNLRVNEVTQAVIGFLNKRARAQFNTKAKGNRNKIASLLKNGYTEEDMRKVVAIKCLKWGGDEKMVGYLRPSTLFSLSHIDDYIGEYEMEKVSGEN